MLGLLRNLYRAVVGLIKDDAFTMAAAVSYYGLFSLFPMLILILAIISRMFHGTELESRVIESVIQWIPIGAGSTVVDEIRRLGERNTGTLTVLGVIGMAWSGSGVFGVLRTSIYAAYDMKPKRSFFIRKLTDIGLILGVGIFFLLSILSSASISIVQKLTNDFSTLHRYPALMRLFGESGLAWSFASYVVPFAVSIVAFFLTYWVIPFFRIPARFVFRGSLVAAVLFEAAKHGFTYYLLHFGRYNIIFGSLSAVVVFLFWVYVAASILILGAEYASASFQASRRK
jgi:membrane protein